MSKVTTTLERITPDIAAEILSHNSPRQRRLSKSRVDAYAHDMMSGDWQQNGETIKIAENGLLLDGQHRLAAVIASGKTLWMSVARNIPNDAFLTIDVGQSRTTRQIINMKNMDRDDILSRKNVVGIATAMLKLAEKVKIPTKPMIVECIESNREAFEWFYDILPDAGSIPVAYGVLAIAAHLYGNNDADIVGFIRGSTRSEFDNIKPVHCFKHCVRAEEARKANKSHDPKAVFDVLGRFYYSYISENVNLTQKTDLYKFTMDSKYKIQAEV